MRELKKANLSKGKTCLQLNSKLAAKRQQRVKLTTDMKQAQCTTRRSTWAEVNGAECAMRRLKRAARLNEAKEAECTTRRLKRAARPDDEKNRMRHKEI